MDKCIICLETAKDISSRINTHSKEWIQGNIQRIIEKHLWWWYMKPLASNEKQIRWICRQCFQEVTSFHVFYCKVEMVHKNYQQIENNLKYKDYSELGNEDVVIKCEIEDTEIYTEEIRELVSNANGQQLEIENENESGEIDKVEIKQEFDLVLF